ncbi:MAG: hypothetical protein ABR574_04190 [Cryomorphaceae bacterium]|nr:hypothetical protein [Flavobacteriales bacterium]
MIEVYNLNHPYYNKPKAERRRFTAKLILGAALVNAAIIVLCIVLETYLIIALSVYLTLILLAPFLDVPALVAAGKLTYFSSFLLAEKEKKGTLKIHGGTLLDYWFTINRSMNGKQRRDFILGGYIQGLLNLIEWAEENDKTELQITGTTPILNRRTAEKLGFKLKPVNLVQLVILVFNYPNLTVAQSISKARLSFPKIGNTKTIHANIGDLKKRRTFMKELCEKLA